MPLSDSWESDIFETRKSRYFRKLREFPKQILRFSPKKPLHSSIAITAIIITTMIAVKSNPAFLEFIELSDTQYTDVYNQAFTLLVQTFTLVIGFGGIFFAMAQAKADYDVTSVLMEESYLYLFASLSILALVYYFSINLLSNQFYSDIEIKNLKLSFVYLVVANILILSFVILRIYKLNTSSFLLILELNSIVSKSKKHTLSAEETNRLRKRIIAKLKLTAIDHDTHGLDNFAHFFNRMSILSLKSGIFYNLNWELRQVFIETLKPHPKPIYDSVDHLWYRLFSESMSNNNPYLLIMIQGWLLDLYNNRQIVPKPLDAGPNITQLLRTTVQVHLDFAYKSASDDKSIEIHNSAFRWVMEEFIYILRRMLLEKDLRSFKYGIEYFNQCNRSQSFAQEISTLEHDIMLLKASQKESDELVTKSEKLKRIRFSKIKIHQINFILKGWLFRLYRNGFYSAQDYADFVSTWPTFHRDSNKTIIDFLSLYRAPHEDNFNIAHWETSQKEYISQKVYTENIDEEIWFIEWLVVALTLDAAKLTTELDLTEFMMQRIQSKVTSIINARGTIIIEALLGLKPYLNYWSSRELLESRLQAISQFFTLALERKQEYREARIAGSPPSIHYLESISKEISKDWTESRSTERIFAHYDATVSTSIPSPRIHKKAVELFYESGKSTITDEYHSDFHGTNLGRSLDQLCENIFISAVLNNPDIRKEACSGLAELFSNQLIQHMSLGVNPDFLLTTEYSGIYSSDLRNGILLIDHEDYLRKNISNDFIARSGQIQILRTFIPDRKFAILAEFKRAFRLTYLENPNWHEKKLHVQIESPSESEALLRLIANDYLNPSKSQINREMNNLTIVAGLHLHIEVIDPSAVQVYYF